MTPQLAQSRRVELQLKLCFRWHSDSRLRAQNHSLIRRNGKNVGRPPLWSLRWPDRRLQGRLALF